MDMHNLNFGECVILFAFFASNTSQILVRILLMDMHNFNFNIILVNLLDSDWLKTVPIKH